VVRSGYVECVVLPGCRARASLSKMKPILSPDPIRFIWHSYSEDSLLQQMAVSNSL
jgi:hypothetical protein